MNKYIGIRHTPSSSNLGKIFELQKDGKYVCINAKSSRSYTQEEIQHDYNKGFLTKINK